MAYRAWFVCSVATFAAGCSIEPLDTQRPGLPRIDSHGQMVGSGQDGGGDVDSCRFELGKGCFDGHVAAKTTFLVDGKQFFNADDLATRFHELLTVASAGKALTDGTDGYQMTLATPLDNASFYQNFEFDLSGPTARSGQVRSDGDFGIDDLPEGNYELRLSKPVRFQLAAAVALKAPVAKTTDGLGGTPPSAQTAVPAVNPASGVTPPAAGGATTAGGSTVPPTGPAANQTPVATAQTQTITRSFCATLYVDATVQVRAGSRTYLTFSQYQLHVTDDQCSTSGNVTSLTLDP